jgi:hypothetical protein
MIKRNEEIEHKCGYEICVNCKREVETKSHLCYMQWEKGKGGICVRRIDEKFMYIVVVTVKQMMYIQYVNIAKINIQKLILIMMMKMLTAISIHYLKKK